MRVATFNAGLAVGVLPHANARLEHVIPALAALEVELLFVQEVWLEHHWERLRRALAHQLPHAFRPPPTHPPSRGCCRAEDVRELVVCGRASCDGLTDEALARCMVAHCAPLALALPPRCLNCIASHPVGDLDEIVGRCVGESPPDEPSASGLIAYGGSFGTGLLSLEALHDVDTIVYASTVNSRGAIYARVAGKHLFATHFSPGGSEHGPQVDRLIAWIEEKVGDAPAILLGDLNTTPGSSLFRRLERAGFGEPTIRGPRGTFASEGLTTGVVRDSGWRLDHVLVRGMPAVAERVLDRVVEIERGTRTTLSDHFGVLAQIDDRR
jgi:endonuclease/exonuclease/phosphatase family metal-dependent hydrolase